MGFEKKHNAENSYCFKWMQKGVLMTMGNIALTRQKKDRLQSKRLQFTINWNRVVFG